MVSDKSRDAAPRAQPFLKVWAVTVLFCFTFEVASPAAQAIAGQVRSRQIAAPVRDDANQPTLGKALQEAKEHLRVLAGRPDVFKHNPTAAQRNAHKAALLASRDTLLTLDRAARDEFAATEQLIKDKGLPDVIRQRHTATVSKYRQEMEALQADLDAALHPTDEATGRVKADAAFKRLDSQSLGRTQQKFDPNHLPNSVLKADPTRRPRVSSKEFRAAGLIDQAPPALFAALNPFVISSFPSATDPAYLAATTEVVLSPDIIAQASTLNGNPVAIYNWVRNNVQWLPTWGAIQDASHTLSSQRGNAFDIASLTIALLRASGIPARYVHGTIDVPAAQFANWAGGFQNIAAAMDFASSGGIPLTALTAGGHITAIRMEHVWVEAAVDFVPSRGAVNKAADSWVALDPSFKQLLVFPGLDVAKISGIDPTQMAGTLIASATTNSSEGWVSGFNPMQVRTSVTQAKSNVQSYVSSTPTATVGDVIGGRGIIAQSGPILPASIPNHIVTVGARYASLPSQLQQQITFAFGLDIDGNPISPKTLPFPQLNNQQVTLSFRPTSPADQQALAAFLPAGGISNISQIPASVPAYLISVVPELKINGSIVMTGSAIGLGSDFGFVFDLVTVSNGIVPYSYNIVAGAYVAVAVIAGSVNGAQMDAVRARVAATDAIVASQNQSQIGALTKEQLLGDMYQWGLLSYYAQYTTMGYVAGLQFGLHHQLAAGLGSFGYEPKVDSFLGIPRSLTVGGIVSNLPIVNVVTSDGGDVSAARNFAILLGAVSSTLEGAVPTQMFNTATSSSTAISAVSALQLANQAGQRTYQISQANQANVMPLIHLDANTMAEIYAALSIGKTVITHTDPVSLPGWSGAGYVILDPVTGEGAWKIAGGANGDYYLLVGLALGLVQGVSAIFGGLGGLPLFTGLSGLGISQYLSHTLGRDELIAFDVGRLVGIASGAVLAVILGEFVLISFTPLFIVGLLLLMINLVYLLVQEIASDAP